MNYTRPDDEDHEDSPMEWLNAALIFTRALSLILEEREGVVVDIEGDVYNPAGESKKVIVFRDKGMIYIEDFEKDLEEGTFCTIIRDESGLN
jgi:hypothetical protein